MTLVRMCFFFSRIESLSSKLDALAQFSAPLLLRPLNQTVMSAPAGVIGPCEALWSDLRAHLARSALQSRCIPAAYHICGCGQGGPRNRSTSRKVQTWSVSPAAIAGVQGRHCLAEPDPLVGTGSGHGWRKAAWGKQK